MKIAAAFLLGLTAATPETRFLRYQRPVPIPEQTHGQACMALDEEVFAHAAPGLSDVRLYHDGVEVPYLLHQVTPPAGKVVTIPPLNLGIRGNQTAFDVEMPEGKYSSVELVVAAENFVAAVSVSGSQTEDGTLTRIGTYTLFDLTQQKLGRGLMLELPESDYRYLHFLIKGPLKAQSIGGIRVARAGGEKPRYVRVARTGPSAVRGRSTVLAVSVPAHVPVDRIVFAPSSQPALFHRNVRVTITPLKVSPDHPAREEFLTEGSLLRVHGIQEGQRIDQEQLEIDVPHAEDSEAATWTISVDNGDDTPLEIESAELEMVERDLCFDAHANGSMTLYYGDAALAAARYDYGDLIAAQKDAIAVKAGPEIANTAWQARPDERPFTERYPWLLWSALCVVVVVLGSVTLQTVKKRA